MRIHQIIASTFLPILVAFPNAAISSETIGKVERLSDWGSPAQISLPSSGGAVPAVSQELSFVYRHVRSVEHVAKFIYVPSRRLFWIGFPYDKQYFILNDSIVGVSPAIGHSLDISQQFNTLTAPLEDPSSQRIVRDSLNDKFLTMSTTHLGFEGADRVNLEEFLDEGVLINSSAAIGPAPIITGVAVGASTVTVNLQIPNIGQAASVVFDGTLQPTAAYLDGQQTFPDVALRPTLTAFTPTSGHHATPVTLTGTNFTGATAVRFGKREATSFTVNGPTQITAYPPDVYSLMGTNSGGAGGSAAGGGSHQHPFTAKITVVTPAGSVDKGNFSVLAPPFEPPNPEE